MTLNITIRGKPYEFSLYCVLFTPPRSGGESGLGEPGGERDGRNGGRVGVGSGGRVGWGKQGKSGWGKCGEIGMGVSGGDKLRSTEQVLSKTS